MKNAINNNSNLFSFCSLKAVLVVLVLIFTGAHGYSNGKGNNTQGNDKPVNTSETKPYKAMPKIRTEVKNIWHNLPSFDRYGNEITPRARFNMIYNEINKK